jgi:hypothetical protein
VVEDVMIAACSQETLHAEIGSSVVGTILIGPVASSGTTAATMALTTGQQTHI